MYKSLRNLYLILLLALGSAPVANAQLQYSFQGIHAAQDPIADTVDVWLVTSGTGVKFLEDFPYGTATSVVDTTVQGVPTTGSVSGRLVLAPSNSTQPSDTLGNAGADVVFSHNDSIYVIAHGTVNDGFNISVEPMTRTQAAGQFALKFFHASPGAPAVGAEVSGIGPIFQNVAYDQATPYTPALSEIDLPYLLQVGASPNTSGLFTFELFPAGLGGANYLAVASGYLNPTMNQPGFNVFVAPPSPVVNGPSQATYQSMLVLPQADTANARVQVLHASPDSSVGNVDIFVSNAYGSSIKVSPPTGLSYPNGSAYIDLPVIRDSAVQVSFIPHTMGSTIADTAGVGLNFSLGIEGGDTSQIVAAGEVNGSGARVFQPILMPNAQESILGATVGYRILHASPGAPAVGAKFNSEFTADTGAGTQDFNRYPNVVLAQPNYRQFTTNLVSLSGTLPLDLAATPNFDSVLTTHLVNAPTSRNGQTGLIFATGYLGAGPGSSRPFQLYALYNNGDLDTLQPAAYLQALHNSADPAAARVELWADVNGTAVPVDTNFAYREGTPYVALPANTPISPILYGYVAGNDTGANLGTFGPLTLETGVSYLVAANGVADTNNFASNPSGQSIALDLDILPYVRQYSVDNSLTKVNVLHGSTNFPGIRIDAGGNNLAGNTFYGEFASIADLPRQDADIEVTDTAGSVLGSWSVPLSQVSDTNVQEGPSSSNLIFASGFQDSTSERAFGLYGLTAYGNVFQLNTVTGLEESAWSSAEFSAYPNPANRSLTVVFDLPEAAELEMELVDLNGQVVYRDTSERLPAGRQEWKVDRNGLPAGLYFLTISSRDVQRTAKIQFLD